VPRAHEGFELVPALSAPEIEERHRLRGSSHCEAVSSNRTHDRMARVTHLWRQPVVLAALMCLSVAACNDTITTGAEPVLVERSHVSMGSSVSVSAWTTDAAAAETAFAKVFAEFDRLDALMSVWKEESEIVRLNAAAGRSAVPIGADVREVLRAAQDVSNWTEGKFDVTFGALSGIWKFDHDIDGQVPDRAEIVSRLPLIDYRDLHIDNDAGTASLAREGMKVHLGGIGKGYAIDRAVTILRDAGLTDFMIQSGGDLFLSGRRGDRPWRVGIQDPRGDPNTLFAAIEITDAAFSTSGDYERFFIRDGRRYHHIIDPDTGEPANRSRSVTIMAKASTIADALSTGVFILGAERGMALIERLPDVEGVMVTADNQVQVSSGLKGRLAMLKQPTNAP
jgi:thiamine biosynthesis lipoprotein